MSKSLGRILRLRRLWEETTRVELEAASRRLRQLEQGVAACEADTVSERGEAFAALVREHGPGRVVAEMSAEFAGWRARELGWQQEQQRDRVAALRETFLEHRKQTGQVEALLKLYQEQLRITRARKEQQALDEWFSQHRPTS